MQGDGIVTVIVWILLVGWLHLGLCKIHIFYDSGGTNISHLLSSDTPVPWNSIYLNTTITAPVLYNQRLHPNISYLGMEYILLCNLTISSLRFVSNCDEMYLKNAKLIINFPPFFLKEPGRSYFYFQTPPLLPPVIELKQSEYWTLISSLQSTNWTLNITISPSHHNIWMEMVQSPLFIFGQVVVCLVSLVAAGGSLYCLVFLPRDRFPQLSHIILILELLANTQRFLYFAIDPLLSRNIFNYNAGVIQETISLPFSLSASLLIGIFWYSLVKYKLHKSNGLLHEKVVFPCLLIVAFICLVEICFDVAIAVLPLGPVEKTFIFVEQTIFVVITIAIFAFYIYTGVMLVLTLKKTNTENPMILKIRLLLRILVGIMLVLLIVCVGFVTPIYETAVGFFGVWFLGHLALACQGVVHVIAFLPGKVEDVSSQKRTSSTNGTKDNVLTP